MPKSDCDASIYSRVIASGGAETGFLALHEKKTPPLPRELPKPVPVMLISVPIAPVCGVIEAILGPCPLRVSFVCIGSVAWFAYNIPLLFLPLTWA